MKQNYANILRYVQCIDGLAEVVTLHVSCVIVYCWTILPYATQFQTSKRRFWILSWFLFLKKEARFI